MHISLGSGKVNVSKDGEGAGVGALVPVPRIVDHEDAGDQVPRHLHTHAEKRLMKEQIVSSFDRYHTYILQASTILIINSI